MKKLLSIPILYAYLYTMSILMQLGYNEYFYLPYSFVRSSVDESIIYFFLLAPAVFNLVEWWWWVLVLFALLTVSLLCFLHPPFKEYIMFVAILIALLFLWQSHGLGESIAEYFPIVYVLSDDCPLVTGDKLYAIPKTYGEMVAIIPVDRGTGRMEKAFLIKNISELGCEIRVKNIGTIRR